MLNVRILKYSIGKYTIFIITGIYQLLIFSAFSCVYICPIKKRINDTSKKNCSSRQL